jgi:hypothetical protein
VNAANIQASTYSSPAYADPATTMGGGTPLIVAVSRAGRADEYQITVKLQLLQAYERAIFELQQQLVHYRALVDVLIPKEQDSERLRFEARPLNLASIRLLNSMLNPLISSGAKHGYDEPDEV